MGLGHRERPDQTNVEQRKSEQERDELGHTRAASRRRRDRRLSNTLLPHE